MLVIFNLYGLAMAFAGAVLGFVGQLVIHPAPLTEGHSNEKSIWLFFLWGLTGIISDGILRWRFHKRNKNKYWWIKPNMGGQMFFVPCWIWGLLWVWMGIANVIRH